MAVEKQEFESTFTFAVLETFKGELEPEVQVRTNNGGGMCGRSYGGSELGGEWLVYAHRHDDLLRDSWCSRTRALAEAEEDIRQLEEVDVDAIEELECLAHRLPGLVESATDSN